jgi:hypothetical protein
VGSHEDEQAHQNFLICLVIGIGYAICDSCGGEKVEQEFRKADGYRGIWYSCNSLKGKIPYKYSGGLATYCAKHIPLAYYSQKANKTFFVYGGTKGLSEENRLLAMVSCYDHETHTVPRPTILREKGTSDGHHNPTIMLDDDNRTHGKRVEDERVAEGFVVAKNWGNSQGAKEAY